MDLKYLTKEGSWEKNPPDLQAEVLRGKRGRLLVTIYRAGGAGLHPTVLLSHGFPGIEKNFDLAQALRRIGFHVVLYHYSGSWGSDGAYAYAHNLEDADTLLEFIETNTTYGFDRERLFVAGHSVGGFVKMCIRDRCNGSNEDITVVFQNKLMNNRERQSERKFFCREGAF